MSQSHDAAAISPSRPYIISVSGNSSASLSLSSFLPTAAISGENFLICSLIASMRVLHVSAAALNLSGFLSIISRACVPMEPVEPSIAIFFICLYLHDNKNYVVVNHRACKKHAVKSVHNTAVSRYQITVVLDAHFSLEYRRCQIPEL